MYDQDKGEEERVQVLIKLGLWDHAKILLGKSDVALHRRDSNSYDIIVRVFWREEVGIVYGFYVDI